MIGWLKRRRRARLLKEPFPREWEQILRANVPYEARLTKPRRQRLRDLTRIFLAEKDFEGCNGLRITDEVRVTIAALASFLLVGRGGDDVYPGLNTVLVYPHAYDAPMKASGPAGIVTEGPVRRAGESWNYTTSSGGSVAGPVILAWDAVRYGVSDPRDGHNVVFHEFAHQLDGQSGGMEGAPALDKAEQYASWSRVLGAEFERLRLAAMTGTPTILNTYGATNPAEFFAVATETYFERAREMQAYHPELFGQLRQFYGV